MIRRAGDLRTAVFLLDTALGEEGLATDPRVDVGPNHARRPRDLRPNTHRDEVVRRAHVDLHTAANGLAQGSALRLVSVVRNTHVGANAEHSGAIESQQIRAVHAVPEANVLTERSLWARLHERYAAGAAERKIRRSGRAVARRRQLLSGGCPREADSQRCGSEAIERNLMRDTHWFFRR